MLLWFLHHSFFLRGGSCPITRTDLWAIADFVKLTLSGEIPASDLLVRLDSGGSGCMVEGRYDDDKLGFVFTIQS